MITYSKTKSHASNATQNPMQSPGSTSGLERLDPKLRLVKNLTDKEEFKRALEALSKNTMDPELLNCRGVCLLRLREFPQAISPFRMAALNPSTFHVHAHVANHIKINFAIALFFGGEPKGGLEALAEVKHSENDPSVLMLHRQTKLWVRDMSLFRRLDWYLNRVAPKKGPTPPIERIGRFVWELEAIQ